MTLLRNRRPDAEPAAPSEDTPSAAAAAPVHRPVRTRLRRWMVLALIVLSGGWLVHACTPRGPSIESYLGLTISEASLSAHVESRRQDYGIAGLAVAVVNDGELVYAEAFGHADVEADRLVTSETIFEGASLSKPVFAHFVMTFVDDGTLDLDRPLDSYLPHPHVDNGEWASRITARMVLSHQAGFPNWRDDQGVTSTAVLPIQFEPGTGYEYSGEGYQYLAMVLAEIMGTDWAGLEALFQERIAAPLGLERMVFIQNATTRRHKAEPYDAEGVKIDWRTDPLVSAQEDVFVAGASVHADATDFSRWMIGLMNEELLSAESYEELFTPHATPPAEQADASYTLGFYQPKIPFTDLHGHTGNNDGFTSFFMFDPEDDWGFVVFTNSEYGEEFGLDLFLHLVTGPSILSLLATIAALGFLVVVTLVFVARAVRSGHLLKR